jgi:hypothetical protein
VVVHLVAKQRPLGPLAEFAPDDDRPRRLCPIETWRPTCLLSRCAPLASMAPINDWFRKRKRKRNSNALFVPSSSSADIQGDNHERHERKTAAAAGKTVLSTRLLPERFVRSGGIASQRPTVFHRALVVRAVRPATTKPQTARRGTSPARGHRGVRRVRWRFPSAGCHGWLVHPCFLRHWLASSRWQPGAEAPGRKEVRVREVSWQNVRASVTKRLFPPFSGAF